MAEKHPREEPDQSGKAAAPETGNSLEETCRKWFGEKTWATMSEAERAKARKLVAGDSQ